MRWKACKSCIINGNCINQRRKIPCKSIDPSEDMSLKKESFKINFMDEISKFTSDINALKSELQKLKTEFDGWKKENLSNEEYLQIENKKLRKHLNILIDTLIKVYKCSVEPEITMLVEDAFEKTNIDKIKRNRGIQ